MFEKHLEKVNNLFINAIVLLVTLFFFNILTLNSPFRAPGEGG